jgi:hypothetical protein
MRAGWQHVAKTTPTEEWPAMHVMALHRLPTISK